MATKILELGERIKSLTLIPSGGGAFEIRANGKLLHSKLDSGDWPDFDQVVTAIKKTKERFLEGHAPSCPKYLGADSADALQFCNSTFDVGC